MFRWAQRKGTAGWLSSRVTHSVASLIGGVGLLTPAAARASDQPPAVSAYTVTPERMAASAAAALGVIGVVIAGLALARSAGRIGGNGRRAAIVALVLGPTGLVIGGLVVATAGGGLGTGHGLGGGIVAMILGLIGMSLGGLALARSRRTAMTPRGSTA
jgi:Family of unknown function (DUF6223)